jgi:ElaB/YqjD/DUF883 family membrane-anchored ribosome-binding protein
MNADTQLHQVLQEWRRLAEAEGEAIRSCNWSLVAECQEALRALQHTVTQLRQTARETWTDSGAESRNRQEAFRQAVSALIEIESRNHAQLSALRQDAQSKISQLESASHTLRRVHRSYSPALPAAWTSFS